jgi:acyl-CoA synthetase (AMP-forming)/AMP-acid ligase II
MGPVFDNLSDAIFHFAKARPSAPAIHEGSSTMTYGELASLVGKAAVYLRDLGVVPGEPLGISLPANADHIILLFAAMRLGAVPVDVPMGRPRPVDPFKLFGVKRVLTAPGAQLPDATVHLIDTAWRESLEGKSGDQRFAGPPDRLLHFSMTSGSTGLPKGIITTQREWSDRYRSAAQLFPDVITAERPPNLLVIGEISFSGFFFFVANQICIGGPIVLIGLVENVEALIQSIRSWDQSAFLMTPQMCRQVVAKASGKGPLFPKARALFIGAAPLFPEEKQAFAKRLTPNLYEVYGSAATGFISALTPSEIAEKANSVGRVAPGIAIDIVDRHDRPVAPGTAGHIRCRGSGVSQRFYGPESGQMSGPEGFRNGAYYPGDIGVIDAHGYLHLKGRISDLISRRGIDIYPAEIESVLAAHPNVAEAAVVGILGAGGQEQVVAVIVPRGEADLESVAQHIRAHLRPEKHPNQLFWANAIPKTGPGKIDKATLRVNVMNRMKSAVPSAAAAPAA